MHARKNNPAQWLSYISWVLLWWMKTAAGSVQGSYSDIPQMKLQVKTEGRHLSTAHSTNTTPRCFDSISIISQLLSHFPLFMCPPGHQAGRGLSISWPCRVTPPLPFQQLTWHQQKVLWQSMRKSSTHSYIASAYIDLTFWMTNTNVVC